MKILIFSDLHNDGRALEKLMAIEADCYIAAGDLVSFQKGLDKMGLPPDLGRLFRASEGTSRPPPKFHRDGDRATQER
jgi:hypothetical protein